MIDSGRVRMCANLVDGLENASANQKHFLASIGVDTAEIQPSEVCPDINTNPTPIGPRVLTTSLLLQKRRRRVLPTPEEQAEKC